jgi:hypothetical protein
MDTIFTTFPPLQKSFFQRLFKQQPPENAIIEVNNLLATQDILSITADQFHEIESRYEIDLKKEFEINLQEFYAVYWNYYLKQKDTESSITAELAHLVTLFNLSDKTKATLQVAIGKTWFQPTVELIVTKEIVTREDQLNIERMRQKLKLPEDIAEKIITEAKQVILDKTLEPIVNKNRCTPAEETKLNNLLIDLAFSQSVIQSTKLKIGPLIYYWQLEHSPLTPITPRSALQKSEVCYYQKDKVRWYETRNDRYGNRHYEFINQGVIYITNKRVLFDGVNKNSTIPYDRIGSISVAKEGIIIRKDKGKDPMIDLSDERTAFEIILKRVVKEFKGFELR